MRPGGPCSSQPISIRQKREKLRWCVCVGSMNSVIVSASCWCALNVVGGCCCRGIRVAALYAAGRHTADRGRGSRANQAKALVIGLQKQKDKMSIFKILTQTTDNSLITAVAPKNSACPTTQATHLYVCLYVRSICMQPYNGYGSLRPNHILPPLVPTNEPAKRSEAVARGSDGGVVSARTIHRIDNV